MRPPAEPDESGQLMVLIIGYTVLCLLVASVVIAASAIHIEHKKLLSAADGAAQAAADSFTIADSAQGQGPPAAHLGQERVHGLVDAYLVRDGAPARFTELAVEGATGSPDGRSAQVTLSAVVRPPLVSFFLPEGIPIQATSTARARLTR